MGLVFFPKLEPMLQTTQQNISVSERVKVGFRNKLLRLQLGKRTEGSGRLQSRTMTAVEQLKRLHKELDLTDAADSEFDVEVALPEVFLLDAPLTRCISLSKRSSSRRL